MESNKLNNFLTKIPKLIITGLVMFIGVLMIFYPEKISDLIIRGLGILLILKSYSNVLNIFKKNTEKK